MSSPIAVLIVRGGLDEGAMVTLPVGSTTIGRRGDSDVVVVDNGASLEHARIDGDVDAHWLQDLGSENGTYVNGERLSAEPRRLRGFDRIEVGGTEPPMRWVYMDSRETMEMPFPQVQGLSNFDLRETLPE